MKAFARHCFTGLAQVFLQENFVTGLFFAAGLLVSSPLMCAGAFSGIITATAAAILLKWPQKNIDAGLYGFNAALVGIALLYFFKPSILLFLLIAAGSMISAAIMHWMLKKLPVPAYTSPFVVTTWGLYVIAKQLKLEATTHASFIAFVKEDVGILDGIGQVMFQENVLTGVLFVLGILYNSGAHGCWALAGSVIGVAAALFLQCPPALIAAGIFSYNSTLCAIALSGKNTPKEMAYPVACAILSVLILLAFQKAGLVALTAPFVIASWIFVVIRGKFS